MKMFFSPLVFYLLMNYIYRPVKQTPEKNMLFIKRKKSTPIQASGLPGSSSEEGYSDTTGKKWSIRKKLLVTLLVFFLAGSGFYILSNLLIASYSSYVHDKITLLPENSIALVLGCSPHVGNSDRENLYFRNRMRAAADPGSMSGMNRHCPWCSSGRMKRADVCWSGPVPSTATAVLPVQ